MGFSGVAFGGAGAAESGESAAGSDDDGCESWAAFSPPVALGPLDAAWPSASDAGDASIATQHARFK